MIVDISKNSNVANWNNLKPEQVISKWLEFTMPINNLSPSEINVFSRILFYRYKYSKDIINPELLDKYIFSTEIKNKVREDLNNMGQDRFQNIMSALRKKNIIKDNRIKNCYIPNIRPGDKNFKILLNFNINDSEG